MSFTFPFYFLSSVVLASLSWLLFDFIYPVDLHQSLSSYSYIPNIGNDELTWLTKAENFNLVNNGPVLPWLGSLYQGLFPLILSFFLGHSVFYFFLFKYILLFWSLFLFFSSLHYRPSLRLPLMLCSALISSNPYLLLLHSSSLRDDIIVSISLISSSILLRSARFEESNNITNKIRVCRLVALYALFALIFLLVRPVVSLCILLFCIPTVILLSLGKRIRFARFFVYFLCLSYFFLSIHLNLIFLLLLSTHLRLTFNLCSFRHCQISWLLKK